ncbi:type II secretion system F family protein [Planctomycetota bacterium]
MTRQLATLLEAGMPLVPALSALIEQLRSIPSARQEQLALVMQHVHDQINAGLSLSKALSTYPRLFSNLYVSMVAAGETGGTLEAILVRLAESLEKRMALTGRVKAALTYPMVMALVAVGVVFFLLGHVVPSLTRIFTEMQRALPAPTRALIALSDFTSRYFLALAVVAICVVAGFVFFIRRPDGRRLWDRTVLRIPGIKHLLLRVEVSRMARTLGTLLNGGVPILRAMEVTGEVIQNRSMRTAWGDIRARLHKGQSLAEAMRNVGLFPPMICHVVATGQQSGTLENGLLHIADMCDNEIEGTLKTLTTLLEPLILLVMGAIVGFVVMAILLPIFDINQAL